MSRTSLFVVSSMLLGWVGAAEAQPALRSSSASNGGMRVIGTTMGHDCGSSVPPPSSASVNCTGELPQNAADSSPDIYYLDGSANALVQPNQARTSATLDLPVGSSITHARLYWGGRRLGLLADETVVLERAGGGSATLTADDSWSIAASIDQAYYQSTADVTSLVSAEGAGEYRLTDMDAIVLPNVLQDVTYAGWALVVFYDLSSAPFSTRSLYDGFDVVNNNAVSANLSLSVPDSPAHPAHLAILAYEGDFDTIGDGVSWDGTPLSNGDNPFDNFFNSSRTTLGLPTVGASDVPALSGVPDSMASFDLDVVDVSSLVSPGNTTATLTVTSTSDTLFLGAVVTELAGCAQSSQCSDPNKPACNLATGDCQPCVVNGDPGVCISDPAGAACLPGGNGVSCGCLDDGDCGPQQTGPHCDTVVNECAECTEDAHCDPGKTCDPLSKECVDGGEGGTSAGGSSGTSSAAGGSSGTATSSGGSSGTAASSGGASSGGSSGTASATGGAGDSGANAVSEDIVMGGGCACRSARPGAGGQLGWLSAALLFIWRRRPNRASPRRNDGKA